MSDAQDIIKQQLEDEKVLAQIKSLSNEDTAPTRRVFRIDIENVSEKTAIEVLKQLKEKYKEPK